MLLNLHVILQEDSDDRGKAETLLLGKMQASLDPGRPSEMLQVSGQLHAANALMN